MSMKLKDTAAVNISGNAATSSKLGTTDVGSTTQPIYLEDGVATPITYTLGKSVPADAKFTDTDTKVTSVGNHYTPAENTDSALSASGGSATNITGTAGKLNVVTGLKRDAKGHVVGVTSANIYSTDNNSTQFTITATATDDDVIVLTGTNGTNKVTFDAKHAKKFSTSDATYTSGNSTTSISGSGGSGTIKVPQITVDSYGHVTAAADESVTITMPSVPVTSVAGKTGAVTLAKSDVGLGNVTNESKSTMFTNAALTGNPTAPTQSAGNNSTRIATTAFVQTEIANKIAAADAMIYKGTIGSNTGDTVTELPSTTAKTGWTYKVATAGTYDSKACEVGDMIICLTDGSSSTAATWTVVQNNIDGAVTGPASAVSGHIATFDGTTGKVIKDSGFTIATSVPSGAKFTDTDTKVTAVGNHYTPAEDTSAAISAASGTATDVTGTAGKLNVVTGVKRDAKGHIVGVTSANIYSKNTTYSAGNGLTLSGTTLAVGAGTGISVAADTVGLAASGVTAGSYGPSSNVTGSHGTTMSVPYITVDTYGRITSISNKTYTAQDNNSTSYLPLAGGTLSGNLNFSGSNFIHWNNGSYQQRIYLTDDSTAGTAVFTFQQSSDTAATWKDLMTIKDDGTVVATTFSGNLAWGSVTGKPSFATVATSGSYNDLSNKPTIPTIPSSLKNPTSMTIQLNSGTTEGTNKFTYDGSTAKSLNITASSVGAAASSHKHTKSEITDFPTLATVATSGSYNDLSNKPTIPTVPSSLKNPNSITFKGAGTSVFSYDGSAAKSLDIVAGSNVTVTADATNSKITIAATDTTYSSKSAASGGTAVSLVTTGEKYTWNSKASTAVATTDANGLMSSTDKTKLNKTNIAYGTCSTAAATAAKVVTLTDNTGWALNAGSIVSVLFTNSNSASNPTLNVNGTGAKNVFYNTSQITTSSLTYAGYANRVATYMYDGTQYRFITWAYDANSTYSQASLGQGYGTCDTAAGTAAKVVTLSSYTLATGGIVSVKFTNAVDASSTMNINSKGAKSIYFKGAAITANIIPAGAVATFIYNGSQYHLIGLDVPRVSISRSLTSGTKIGTITIDGTGTDLYCQTNTNTTYSAGSGLTLSSTTFNVGAGTGISVAEDTVGISSTYQTYISNGNTAYGWGNHANAGYTKNTGTVTKISTGKGLTGGDISTTGTIKCNLNSETSLGTIGTTSKLYAVGVDANNKLCVNVPWTDNNTTYSSKTAASGGTDVSLVTTGEKYIWNSKTSNTGTVTSITLSAGTGISLDSTSAITTSGTRTISLASGVLGTGTAGTQYGPTAAVTGNNNSTINVPYLKVDTYGRVTTVGHYALTCKNTTYSVATASANGLMAAADKSLTNFLNATGTATTLASLDVSKSTIYATLSAATTISLSGTLATGRSITVICNPTASFTQPIPTSGSFISMDGDSLSVTSGKFFEINIYAYASGAYSISCKTAK